MLVITDLTYRIGHRVLLDHATVTVPAGAHVGLVGRNGTGKTTLFHIIAGEIMPEQGQVLISPRDRIGRLAQEAPNGPESLLDIVLQADAERTKLLAEAETEREPARIAEIQLRLADIRRPRAPPGSSPAWAFPTPTSNAPAPNSPGDGACGSRSRQRCSPNLTSSFSTSRPTISTSRRRCGWRRTSRAIRARSWSSVMTATCSTKPS